MKNSVNMHKALYILQHLSSNQLNDIYLGRLLSQGGASLFCLMICYGIFSFF